MLTVKRSGGVVVEYGGDGIIFDPSAETTYPTFVSHAHADHTAAFRYENLVTYTTNPTYSLLNALGYRIASDWRPIQIGDKVKVGDVEVRIHNAGHILGSVQFEAMTPEGTVLYTGDFDTGKSYTMEPAEAVGCDILVVETTFGAPMFSFPKRREVALEMVRWAIYETIPKLKVPAFMTDSIGNAQEIISIFNRMTNLPVVTAKSVTKASEIYREHGYDLEYIDANSEGGIELLDSGRCVLITPKGSKLKHKNLEVALASGWASIMKRNGVSFPLSDHADFRGLLQFIQRCHPKRVLTFHGGALTKGFPNYVKKRLGIDAKPLTRTEETIMGSVSRTAKRMKWCTEQLLRTVKIPGFVYSNPWLLKEMARRGFTQSETQNALQRLIDQGVLVLMDIGVKLS